MSIGSAKSVTKKWFLKPLTLVRIQPFPIGVWQFPLKNCRDFNSVLVTAELQLTAVCDKNASAYGETRPQVEVFPVEGGTSSSCGIVCTGDDGRRYRYF